MSFQFTVKEFILGNGTGTPTFQFYKKGFNLYGGSYGPSWQDIVLSGNGSLTLTNAKANGLNYLKLFGGTEQTGTPTPDAPIDIVSNNGVLKFGALGKNLFNPTKVLFGYYRDRTTGIKQQSSSNFMSSDDGYIPCLPNTTYTFVGTDKTNGTYSKYNTIYFFDSAKNYLGASPYDISQPTTGTTPNNCYYLQVRSNPLDNSTPIQDAFAQFNWQLEQGSTATAYEPYQEGIYTDGTTETVNVHSRNLFDVDNNLLEGYYIESNTGILRQSSDGSSSCFKDFLPSKPNVTYTMSRLNITASTMMRMWAYDENKNPISLVFNSTGGATKVTGTTPNDTAYIRCSFGSIPQYSQNIQLELGSTATEYEPYYNGGSATAEMLLKIGTYQDVQSALDGEVTRNVGVKVLDGSENFELTGTVFTTGIANRKPEKSAVICSHFLYSSKTSTQVEDERIITFQSANVGFKYNACATIADFKQWLKDQYNSGNPVIVIYPLATATTESVESQALTIQAGTNIVEITQASINNLGLEVSYKGTV